MYAQNLRTKEKHEKLTFDLVTWVLNSKENIEIKVLHLLTIKTEVLIQVRTKNTRCSLTQTLNIKQVTE